MKSCNGDGLKVQNILIGNVQVTSCRGQGPLAEYSLNFAECVVSANSQLISPGFLKSQVTYFLLQST